MAKNKHGKSGSVKVPPAEENQSIDWTAYMFGGYNADQDKVSLYRMSPKEHQGVPTAGWLDDLGPGVDENYIRDNYGGGSFRLNKRNRANGQISATCSFEIPGFPKVGSGANPKAIGEDLGASAPVTMRVDGVEVPFDGDLKRFSDFIMVLKGIKSVFPDPPDINAGLLEMAMKREPAPDPLDAIRAAKEAADLFGGSGGQAGTGATLYDLLNTAISQAGTVIQSMTSPGLRRIANVKPAVLPGPTLVPGPGNVPGAAPVGAGADAGDTVDITPGSRQGAGGETTSTDEAYMSQRELILSVSSTIVQCWKLNPPKDVSATVRMVDLILQESEAAVRKTLADNFGPTIFDVCETQLAEDWAYPESTVGSRDDFGVFFEKVFVEYARDDRTVVGL